MKKRQLISRSQFEAYLVTYIADLKLVRVTGAKGSQPNYLLEILPSGGKPDNWKTLAHTRYHNQERMYKTANPV